jgi:hypothetical protein
MSEIDFCVHLTEKTEKDQKKYIRDIISMFNVILDNSKPLLSQRIIQELYKKCRSETVRYHNLTDSIIQKINENLSSKIKHGEITFSDLEKYLNNEIIERINLKGDKASEIIKNLSYEEQKEMIETLIQNISRGNNIQNLPDSLFLPVEKSSKNKLIENRFTEKYEQSVSKLQKEFHEYEEKYNELVRIENKNIEAHRAEVTKFLDTGRSIKRRGTLLELNIKESTIDDTIKKKLISQTRTISTTAHRYNMGITLKYQS